jgi:mannosyltransferase
VADAESTPPLYYVLAWGWVQGFGNGEVGLRSLSALLGTATVPVAYLAGATLLSRRAGLVAAALVAVSPLMIWYSQEARAYALLVLLGAVALWLFVRVLDEPAPRPLAWWAFASALAVLTHYYALFLVLPMGVWLVVRSGARRDALLAAATPAAVALALVPLALAQRSHGGASAVSAEPLTDRIEATVHRFLTGEYGGPVPGLTPLTALLVAAAVVLLVTRAAPAIRRRAGIAAVLGVLAILLPLALALVGVDYFTGRYLLAAWLPLALVCAGGLATPGRLGGLLTAALCALLLTISIAVPLDPELQRDDWRSIAERLGRPERPRAIAVYPYPGFVPLDFYVAGADRLPRRGARVNEVAVVSVTRDPAGGQVRPPVPGFTEVERVRRPGYALVRFRAPRGLALRERDLARTMPRGGRPGLLLQRSAEAE